MLHGCLTNVKQSKKNNQKFEEDNLTSHWKCTKTTMIVC